MSKENVVTELANLIETGKHKYRYVPPLTVAVENGTSKTVILTLDKDASFLWQTITGSIIAPSDINGKRLTAMPTDFPLAGAGVAGYADHGLSMKITDVSSGRDLTGGFVPCELLLTPGYREQFFAPLAWNYPMRENTKLRFEFMNRDTAVDPADPNPVKLYHYVAIALPGFKFTVESPAR